MHPSIHHVTRPSVRSCTFIMLLVPVYRNEKLLFVLLLLRSPTLLCSAPRIYSTVFSAEHCGSAHGPPQHSMAISTYSAATPRATADTPRASMGIPWASTECRGMSRNPVEAHGTSHGNLHGNLHGKPRQAPTAYHGKPRYNGKTHVHAHGNTHGNARGNAHGNTRGNTHGNHSTSFVCYPYGRRLSGDGSMSAPP